eukprot:scaffold10220_cov144-Isochrysis_galbana.AAC.8
MVGKDCCDRENIDFRRPSGAPTPDEDNVDVCAGDMHADLTKIPHTSAAARARAWEGGRARAKLLE